MEVGLGWIGADVVLRGGAGDWACTGVGVGVGAGDREFARLYFIWLNATEATNNDATVETMIRVIIGELRFEF